MEVKMGRKALETWLDQQHGRRITMTDYPRGEKNVSALREKINALLE